MDNDDKKLKEKPVPSRHHRLVHARKLFAGVALLTGLSITILCGLLYFYYLTPAPQAVKTVELGPIALTDDAASVIDPTTQGFDDNIADLLDATNVARQNNGAKPLAMNSKLNISGKSKCDDMVNRNYWEHNDPDGHDPYRFISKAGVSYSQAGENLAYGFKNSREVVDGWMKSPSHKENLLNSDYTQVGFGVCESDDFIGQGKQTIVVQHLTRP